MKIQCAPNTIIILDRDISRAAQLSLQHYDFRKCHIYCAKLNLMPQMYPQK